MSLSFRLIAIALASTAAFSASAVAADAPVAPAAAAAPGACPPPGSANAQIVIITKPKWLYAPTGEDMINFYPHMEYTNQKNGKTLMDCAVTEKGKLDSCRILEDEKPGRGYDKASLKLAKIYQMAPLDTLPEWTTLPECVRKAGPPHIVMPVSWRTHFEMPPAGTAPAKPGK